MPETPSIAPARARVLAEVADDIGQRRGPGILRVAVDGVDGAGKTIFADELAVELRRRGVDVVRVSVDGFHHPAAIRHGRGRGSPEGFYEDSYDYDAFRRLVLEPLGPGGSRRYVRAIHDVARDVALPVEAEAGPDDGVLVVDGIFLHRPELAGHWDRSIFLDVPVEVSIRRCAERDGGDPDPAADVHRRYIEGQRLYLERCQPQELASVVIDNTDLDRPLLVRRDADGGRPAPHAAGEAPPDASPAGRW